MNDVTAKTSNYYGYELRLAQNKFNGDTSYVTCPLRRSACQYDSQGICLGCNRLTDKTYLTGYTVTLQVQQYDANFKYWRGISGCSIKTYESNQPLKANQIFREVFVLEHFPPPTVLNTSNSLLLLCFLVFALYFVLYFCRRKHCVVCQKKLVCSMNRCYICQYVGAEPPDPALMESLEMKGVMLQGVPPERYVLSHLCRGFRDNP